MSETHNISLGLDAAPAGPVFLTGGSGRVGTCLRNRLRPAGYDIRFTDRVEPADGDMQGFVKTDLADQDSMAEAMRGCRALIHLGGHPRDAAWAALQQQNITGTYNAFNAARRAGVTSIIFSSSNQICGLNPADSRLDAQLPINPAGLYGVSKAFGEAMLRAEAEARGISAFALRIAAFKPEPETARDLRLWLSLDDAARLVDAALWWTEPGYNMVWGVSQNSRCRIDDPIARAIGYAPRDNDENYASKLQATGINIDIVSEWSCLGGEKADEWLHGKT